MPRKRDVKKPGHSWAKELEADSELADLIGTRAAHRPKGSVKFHIEDYADSLLEWLSQGRTMSSWCRLEGNPSVRLVCEWQADDKEFGARVARAREIGFHVMAEQTLQIADDGSNDEFVTDDGRVVTNTDVVARSKLRVDTRFKLLACWDPRRYGPKAQVEHTGKVTLEQLVGGDEDDGSSS